MTSGSKVQNSVLVTTRRMQKDMVLRSASKDHVPKTKVMSPGNKRAPWREVGWGGWVHLYNTSFNFAALVLLLFSQA